MAVKRIHVFYSGHVQGVGFRFTTQDIASELGLNGWVKNLGDGRVEVVCEGDEEKLKAFVDNITNSFIGRYIRDTVINWEKPIRESDSFNIKF